MKNQLQARFVMPLILFLLIIACLWRGLSLHPNEIPSPLINKNSPAFTLPNLFDPKVMSSNKDFLGHVTLLNVWATWCAACLEEHPELMELARKDKIIFYGIDYKDDPALAKKWLNDNGNPFQVVVTDQDGAAAINWGVYGTPETFIIDKKGVIRSKQIGEITPLVWENTLAPLIAELEKEPA